MEHTPLSWLNWYQQQLRYVGIALFCCGILYILAANWFYFPPIVQLLIPQLLLLLACLASTRTALVHYTAIVACVMIGLSLASYGQVYQTGADSFQLFAVWSLLLLPWLYLRQAPIYILLCITTLLTFGLAHEQVLFWSPDSMCMGYFVLLSFFLLVADYFFPSSRMVLMLIVSGFSIIASFNGILRNPNQTLWWLLALLLPSMFFAFYHFRRWPIGMTLSGLMIAIAITLQISSELIDVFKWDFISFSLIALLLFVWCWGIGKVLHYFLPNSPYLTAIPIAFGAWSSSLFLSAALFALTKLMGIDNNILIAVGIVVITVAIVVLKQPKPHTVFLRHSMYAILLAGQCTLLISLGNQLYNYIGYNDKNHYQVIALGLLLCQLILFPVTSYFIRNQFWRALQATVLILLFYWNYPLLILWLIAALFAIYYFKSAWLEEHHWRRIWFIAVCLLSLLQIAFLSITEYMSFLTFPNFFAIQFAVPWTVKKLLIGGLTLLALLTKRQYIPRATFIALALLILFLCYFALFDILILLALLLLLSLQKDTLMHWIVLLALAIALWMEYYDIRLTLLLKGSLIIGSGIMVILLTMAFPKPTLSAIRLGDESDIHLSDKSEAV